MLWVDFLCAFSLPVLLILWVLELSVCLLMLWVLELSVVRVATIYVGDLLVTFLFLLADSSSQCGCTDPSGDTRQVCSFHRLTVWPCHVVLPEDQPIHHNHHPPTTRRNNSLEYLWCVISVKNKVLILEGGN